MLQYPLFRGRHIYRWGGGNFSTRGEESGGSLGELGFAALKHTMQAFEGPENPCQRFGGRRPQNPCSNEEGDRAKHHFNSLKKCMYQNYRTPKEHLETVSPANSVGISDTNFVGYCDYNRSSAESIRSQPNGRMSRDRSYTSKSQRSGRSHHGSSSSRSSSCERGSARRHRSSRHSKSDRSHRQGISSSNSSSLSGTSDSHSDSSSSERHVM